MNIKIEIYSLIITITYLLKFTKTEEIERNIKTFTNENSNQLIMLQQIVIQLEEEVEKLKKSINQQAEIVYNSNHNEKFKEKTEPKPESYFNCSAKIQKFYNDINLKLSNLKKSTEDSILLFDHDQLGNKSDTSALISQFFNKCLENVSSDSNTIISQAIEKLKQIVSRFDSLKQKLYNMNEIKTISEEYTENLGNMMIQLNTMLESQNHKFEYLDKQLLIIQGASKTLDDFIIWRNEYLSFHQECWGENCYYSSYPFRNPLLV